MRRIVLSALLLLAACAHDDVLLRPLPIATEPSTEVTVIRPRSIVMEEWPVYVVVAGQPVFDLRNGENTRFRVSSGRSSLAIQCGSGISGKPNETRIEHDLPPRGSAYFIVEPKSECVAVKAVDVGAAAADLRTTRFREVGTVNRMAQATADAPAAFSSLPAPPPPASLDQRGLVAATTAAWIEAFNNRDVARIASLYDTEAVLRDLSGQRIAAGPAGIAEYFRNVKTPAKVSLSEQEVRVAGDTAIDSGATTLGRYNVVYRNRNGKWLIIDHNLSAAK